MAKLSLEVSQQEEGNVKVVISFSIQETLRNAAKIIVYGDQCRFCFGLTIFEKIKQYINIMCCIQIYEKKIPRVCYGSRDIS